MEVSRSVIDVIEVLRLKGRFDYAVQRVFQSAAKEAVENQASREIQVDLREVKYVDSSALGMLLTLRDDAKAVGKTVAIIGATGPVRSAFAIANFEALFVFK